MFIFSSYKADFVTGDLAFTYEVEKNGDRLQFVERWHIPNIPKVDNDLIEVLDNAMQALHLIVGISYYKAFLPSQIRIDGYELSQEQAEVWNTIYTKGLGEFFYKNKIDYRGLVNFPYSKSYKPQQPKLRGVNGKALVLHGGGKDSLVTAEIVKASGVDYDLFCLNPKHVQQSLADFMQIPLLSIHREIDQKLLSLNARGETYNGHVPISTIYTFAATLMALLHGHKYTIISSEHSSSYGNVTYLDEEINHQWSKSQDAETILRSYINSYISVDMYYFSMLRPFYEIGVVKKFTKFPKYFERFSSSNHHFALEATKPSNRWDYNSSKTVFVYTMLSAFLSKDEMQRIFGEILYDKAELIPHFEELLGLTEVKPFECVGTPEEMIVAMKMARDLNIYSETPVMKMFSEKVLLTLHNFEELKQKVFSQSDDTHIPDIFKPHL